MLRLRHRFEWNLVEEFCGQSDERHDLGRHADWSGELALAIYGGQKGRVSARFVLFLGPF